MKKSGRFSRRKILSAAGLGAAAWAFPRVGLASSLPSSARRLSVCDIPGGAQLAREALERYRSAALRGAGAAGAARFDLGGGFSLEVEAPSGNLRSIVIESPRGALELECSSPRSLSRVIVQLEESVAGAHPSGFDTLRATDDGVELTFSDDLALRYALPEKVAEARMPAVYDELAQRVLAGRGRSR